MTDASHTTVAETTSRAAADMEQLFADYGDAWASRDADAIARFHADEGIFQLHAGAEAVRGRDAIRDTFAGFLAQFPDLAFAEQQRLVADWGWVVRWTMSGTLAAPFDTGTRVVEPGGRMEVDAVDVITVEDGLLTAKHTYMDWATALRQFGLE
jgi:steroid delta-isomerase-like uncharacterized protein